MPDESLLYAVTTAAHRGVAVELFVSEEADQFMVHHAQQSYYQELLEAGVRIFLYPKPWVLHSKHFSVDDHVAVIGSSNMDMRSFALNYEVSVMFLDDGVVRDLRRVEDGYRVAVTRADPRRVERAVAPVPLRRQRHAAHRRPAVGRLPRLTTPGRPHPAAARAAG